QQSAQPGEDDQAHHPRLGQREQVAPVGRKALVLRDREARHVGAYRVLDRKRKGRLAAERKTPRPKPGRLCRAAAIETSRSSAASRTGGTAAGWTASTRAWSHPRPTDCR